MQTSPLFPTRPPPGFWCWRDKFGTAELGGFGRKTEKRDEPWMKTWVCAPARNCLMRVCTMEGCTTEGPPHHPPLGLDLRRSFPRHLFLPPLCPAKSYHVQRPAQWSLAGQAGSRELRLQGGQPSQDCCEDLTSWPPSGPPCSGTSHSSSAVAQHFAHLYALFQNNKHWSCRTEHILRSMSWKNENKTTVYVDMNIDVWKCVHIYKEICLYIFLERNLKDTYETIPLAYV